MFAHASEYRSDSEDGKYANVVLKSLASQKAFESFKRNRRYQRILEHVTQAQGQSYLDILRARDDGLLEAAQSTVFVSDATGDPVKYSYDGIDAPLSPTTLRYVKVASDLRALFGPDAVQETAEIGCGYGGQCLVNDALLGYEYATLFDLPFVNALIERYLGYTLLNGAFRTLTINEARPTDYDLVISNYAFSELPAALQRGYIRKVLAGSKRGYLTMNSGIGAHRDTGKLSLEDLREALPPFAVLEEQPVTAPHNYILVWGHDPKAAEDLFTAKQV